MDLQLVTLEQAKGLNKLGFSDTNENHKVYYASDDKVDCVHFRYIVNRMKYGWKPDWIYSAPLLMEASRWLEKNKNIICWPSYNPHGYYYVCVTHKESSNLFQDYIVGKFYDYELALNAAINVALKVLNEFEQKLEKKRLKEKMKFNDTF